MRVSPRLMCNEAWLLCPWHNRLDCISMASAKKSPHREAGARLRETIAAGEDYSAVTDFAQVASPA